MRKNIATLALLTALGAATLSGCTATGTGGGKDGGASSAATSTQTVAEACALSEASMSKVQTDLSGSMTALGNGDVSAGAEAMAKLGDAVDQTLKKISNAKVKEALGGLGDKITEFGDLLASAKDGGVQALADKGDELQSVVAEMRAAGTKLSKLCS